MVPLIEVQEVLLGLQCLVGKPGYIKIYNSFNIGDILGGKAGGFLGNITPSNLNIYNSYNLAVTPDENAGIVFQCSTDSAIILSNVFHTTSSYIKTGPESVTTKNVRQITSDESKTQVFVDELNTNIKNGCPYEIINEDETTQTVKLDTIGWAKWIYIQNSYPTLDKNSIWNGTEWVETK